jgi:hypothetical protein
MKLQTVDAKPPIPLGDAHAVWEGNLDTFDKTPRILRNEFIHLNRTDGAVVIESFGSSGRHAVRMWHDRQLIFAHQGKLGGIELPIAPFNLSVSGICAAIDPSAANPVRIAVGLSTIRHYSEELRKKLVESPPELAALEALKAKGNEPRPLFDQMKRDIEETSTGLERLMLFETPSKAPELVGREILTRPMSVLGKKMNLEPVGFSSNGRFLYVHCKYMETKSSPKPVHGLMRIELAQVAKGRDSRELVAGASDDERTFLLGPWKTFSRKDELFASYLTEVRPTEWDAKVTTSLMVVDLNSGKRYRLTGPGITSDVLASGRLPATFLPDRTFSMAINAKVMVWRIP